MMLDENDVPDDGEDDGEEGPLHSLVLLRRSERYLEPAILGNIISHAWDCECEIAMDDDPEDELPDDKTVLMGDGPLFMVSTPMGFFIVHNHDESYFEDSEELADEINELRIRKAILDHKAWLSVDFVFPRDETIELDAAYRQIQKLIEALADEDTLAICHPATQQIVPWSEEILQVLMEGVVEDVMQMQNSPVVPIEADHPLLLEAVAKAQASFDEFLSAFKQRGPEQDDFVIKVRLSHGECSEFIWLNFLGAEPRYLHGTLANDPVDLGDLKIDDQVEVPIEEMIDWGYSDNGEFKGMYSVAAIQQILAEEEA